MWTRARFVDEYVPGLFAVAIDSYGTNRAQAMWDKLVTVKTSQKKKEENSERSGLDTPVVKPEGAGITYDTQISGAKQTWVHAVYALGVRITEEAVEDNLYELRGGSEGNLKELFHDLGQAMSNNIEVLMARFLNSGTATTYHTERDGSTALYSDSHTLLGGDTFDNKSVSADLTYSAFWTVLVAAENQYNHRGHRIKKRVEKLWYPPQLERKALEILKSTDRPDTANRAVNAFAKSGRSIQSMNWNQLTDVDAWHMQLEGEGIIFFWRRKTRFAREGDFQTGDIMVKSDQRFSAEINDYRCFYGNVPA
jgi:hypothetical protein